MITGEAVRCTGPLRCHRRAAVLGMLLVLLMLGASAVAVLRVVSHAPSLDAAALRGDGALRLAAVRGMALQNGTSDCGAATLRNFALVTARARLADELASGVRIDLFGTTVGDMQAALARAGIATRAARRTNLDLAPADVPAIVLLRQHYVVATGRTASGRLDVLDPWLGHVALDRARFRREHVVVITETRP